MDLHVRPHRPGDLEAIVAIQNAIFPSPVTLEELRFQEENYPKDRVRRRFVAELQGQVAGHSGIIQSLGEDSAFFWFWVLVHPDHRGMGAGKALYAATMEAAVQAGARTLQAGVRDNLPDALAWAERRGWVKVDHNFQSVLDITGFDFSRSAFIAATERLEEAGYRFRSMAELPGEERRRELFRAWTTWAQDMPNNPDPSPPPYEVWERALFGAPDADPAGILVGLHNDRIVALTALHIRPDGSAYSRFTAVDPAHRGKGLSLAIKLLSIAWAQKRGIKRLRTNNDSQNPAMISTNKRLGYVPEPGWYGLRKTL